MSLSPRAATSLQPAWQAVSPTGGLPSPLSPPSRVPSWWVLGFQPFPEHYIWSYCFQLLFSHHLSSFARGHRLSGRVAEAPGCLRLRRPLGTTLSPQEAAVLLPHLLWAHTALSQRPKLYLGPEFISHPWASCFRDKAVSQSVLWPESYYCSKALMLKTARKITTENFHMKWMGKKRNDRGEVHLIPPQAGAVPEMHPFPLTTLATTEPGAAGTHSHYLTQEALGSERLCDVPKFPQFKGREFGLHMRACPKALLLVENRQWALGAVKAVNWVWQAFSSRAWLPGLPLVHPLQPPIGPRVPHYFPEAWLSYCQSQRRGTSCPRGSTGSQVLQVIC